MSTPPEPPAEPNTTPSPALPAMGALIEQGQRQRHGRGTVVADHHTGNPREALVLVTGHLKTTYSTPDSPPELAERIVELPNPGDLLIDHLDRRPEQPAMRVIALEDCEILHLPLDAFEAARALHPELREAIAIQQRQRLRSLLRLHAATTPAPPARVLAACLDFVLGRPQKPIPRELPIPLDGASLCQLTGLTMPQLYTAIANLDHAGIVGPREPGHPAASPDSFVVLDPTRLPTAATPPPDPSHRPPGDNGFGLSS